MSHLAGVMHALLVQVLQCRQLLRRLIACEPSPARKRDCRFIHVEVCQSRRQAHAGQKGEEHACASAVGDSLSSMLLHELWVVSG